MIDILEKCSKKSAYTLILTWQEKRDYIHKAFTLPPHMMVKKTAGRIKRAAFEALLRRKDHRVTSYMSSSPKGTLYSYLTKLDSDYLSPHAKTIASVTKHYLTHCFDLLGSGWVRVYHGMKCRGLEGYRYEMGGAVHADPEGQWLEGRINNANLEESKRIWSLIFTNQPKTLNLKSKTYIPIDWQLDFKSGYRWSEKIWCKDIKFGHKFGHKLGVDIKVPWELARMQHLPQLAWAYALSTQSATLKAQGEVGLGKIKFENWKSIKGQLEPPECYALQFRSQVLDFIATNPPRFGVNWACAMDVGIRVANWLVAYDLFRTYGTEFDGEFEKVFFRGVYEHGLYIINNLEWNEEHRSNHYLSNIAGLLFVAAYLPGTPEIDAWLALAVQELINEVENQFYPDGGNFEASTSYHRLSAEMVTYATALVLGLPANKTNALKNYDHTLIKVKPGLTPSPLPHYKLSAKNNPKSKTKNQKSESPFLPWYFERLEKMAEFTMHITKPNNHIPQIGDNDSGRFFKLQPVYKKMTVAEAKKRYLNLEGYENLPDDVLYWDEDFLDHRHLVAAINGLFERDDFNSFTGSGWLETDLVRNLARGICLASHKKGSKPTAAEQARIGSDNKWNELRYRLEDKPENQKQTVEIPLPDGAVDDLKLYAYPKFGLYIYRSKRLYLAIRCGPVGQNSNGGHAHNDQLSIELNVDEKDIIVDPGTYLYTPLPERRNEYRSVKAHFAPQVEGHEPGNLDAGLFKLGDEAKAECLYFGSEGIVGSHLGFGSNVWLYISLHESELKISHIYSTQQFIEMPRIHDNFNKTNIALNSKKHSLLNKFLSPSYGKKFSQTLA